MMMVKFSIAVAALAFLWCLLLAPVVMADEDSKGLDKALALANRIAAEAVKPKPNSNPDGKVVALTDATFGLLTNNTDWFVKFYAPWCGHCKHLAPVWEELGSSLRGKLNIGKVDCTENSKVCEKYSIRGYPTLKLMQEPFGTVDYKGHRTLESLEAFATSFSKVPFKAIKASEIGDIIHRNDVAGFYVYDPESLDKTHFENFARVAASLRGEVPLFVSPDTAAFSRLQIERNSKDSVAFMMVKDGGTVRMRFPRALVLDTDTLRLDFRHWIVNNKHALVPMLDAHNADEIFTSDRLVVIGIVDPADPKAPEFMGLLRLTARAWAKKWDEDASQKGRSNPVLFSWLDGRDKLEYVGRVYGIKEGDMPRIIFAEPRTDSYYDRGLKGKVFELEKDKLIENLDLTLDGKLYSKSTHGFFGGIMSKIAKTVEPFANYVARNFTFVFGIIMVVILGLVFYISGIETSDEVPNEKKD